MANIAKRDSQSKEVESHVSPFSLVDRFFEDSFLDPFNVLSPSFFGGRRLGVNMTFPKVDVSETDSEIKVAANVPGIDPEKIDIEVGDDYLALSRKIEKENKDQENGKVYRYEREYGEFRREFALPARVDKEGIVAKVKNGVLSVTLPKTKDERKSKIKVQVEK